MALPGTNLYSPAAWPRHWRQTQYLVRRHRHRRRRRRHCRCCCYHRRPRPGWHQRCTRRRRRRSHSGWALRPRLYQQGHVDRTLGTRLPLGCRRYWWCTGRKPPFDWPSVGVGGVNQTVQVQVQATQTTLHTQHVQVQAPDQVQPVQVQVQATQTTLHTHHVQVQVPASSSSSNSNNATHTARSSSTARGAPHVNSTYIVVI